MKTSHKGLPQLNHRSSLDDEESGSYPGRLHTIQRKIKFNNTNTLVLSKRSTPLTGESQILKHIDYKLETHKKDIEQRNDMINHIEKGFENVKMELVREKQLNEEKARQLLELQTSYHAVTLKLKQLQSDDQPKPNNDKHIEKIAQLEASLKQSYDNSTTLSKQIEQLNVKLQTMVSNEELSKYREENKKVKELLRKQEEQYHQLQNQLKITLDKEQAEKDALKKQLDQQKSELESRIQTLNKEGNTLRGQVKQLEGEKNHLQESLKKQKSTESTNKKQQDLINQLKQELSEFQKCKDSEMSDMKTTLEAQVRKLQNSEQVLELSRKELEELRSTLKSKASAMEISVQNYEKRLNQQQNEIEQLTAQIDKLKIPAPKQNFKGLNDTLSQLESTEKEIQKNLICTYCNKFIKQPVTIIPCGHSYCYDCKKGYSKECSKCGPKLKVEAMYRNELLDDIIEMVKLISSSIANIRIITK